MSMEPLILLERADGVATIKLNRPRQLNALNSELNEMLLTSILSVKEDLAMRALIITGAGSRAFAAGADITDMVEATPEKALSVCQLAIDVNNALEELDIPTIAAVNGLALGGGMELALACDLRVGGSRTVFSFPEAGLGIIPGANGCARVVTLLGPSRAKQVIMLGEQLSGKSAFELGLLNWLVEGDPDLDSAALTAKAALKEAGEGVKDDIDAAKELYKKCETAAAEAEAEAVYKEAVKIATRLSAMPGRAIAAAKATVNHAIKEGVPAGKLYETERFTQLFSTHDQKEGMRAMLEKRKAVFAHN